MKIDKKEFDSLYDDEITKKEYDCVMGRINDRFGEIILDLCPKARGGNNWFDYGNLSYDGEVDGFFDPDEYKEWIDVFGYGNGTEKLKIYGYAIPTRWLWEEDYVKEFEADVKAEQERELKAKRSRAASAKKRKEKRAKLKKSIEQKLTEEELRIIKFK